MTGFYGSNDPTNSVKALKEHRKRNYGQKKKIGKANERKRKVKRGKDEEVNGQEGKRGTPAAPALVFWRPYAN